MRYLIFILFLSACAEENKGVNEPASPNDERVQCADLLATVDVRYPDNVIRESFVNWCSNKCVSVRAKDDETKYFVACESKP